jgi:hypothetical protein
MAQEITVNASLSATKSGRILPTVGGQFQPDWSGKDYDEGIISAATTAAGVAFSVKSSLSAIRWAYFKNLDSTNYVEIGPQHSGTTFMPTIRLLPGEWIVVPIANLAITDLFYRANTSAVDLQFIFVEP